MSRTIAATCSLIVFAACLVKGGFEAGNPFTTTVGRALLAMAGTFIIGLVLGAMAERMIQEARPAQPENSENSSTDSGADDR